MNQPICVAVDSSSNIYIGDYDNYRVRKVSNGLITTVAGNGTRGFSGDNGQATNAQLAAPAVVAIDGSGNPYMADQGNDRVRKVSNGVITTVAGNGTRGFGGDNGPATSAQLWSPFNVALGLNGTLYIVDPFIARVRKVSNGVITTVAGNGTRGFSGDNCPAISAQLNDPAGVALDAAGNLYIVANGDHSIRKVSNGVITTAAGNGTEGTGLGGIGDNGPAVNALLVYPIGVAVDGAGNIYFSEVGRIRKIAGGIITTVAGNGANYQYNRKPDELSRRDSTG